MPSIPRALWMVVLADVVLTYAYAFVAVALTPPEGPHAPATYWLTQAWVYALIAPVAAVAAWRGAGQVLNAWAGRPRWWRLTLEGAAFGAAGVVIFAASGHTLAEVAMSILEVGAITGGLGVVLTGINLPLARLHRPVEAGGPETGLATGTGE